MMEDDEAAAAFLAAVQDITRRAPDVLNATGAAILLATHLGLATDSRSIARRLGLAHAIVLREIAAASPHFIRVAKRDSRTQRTWVKLTEEGSRLAGASVSS